MEEHSKEVRRHIQDRKYSQNTTRKNLKDLEEAVVHVHLTASDIRLGTAISLSGKYSKQALSRLEESKALTPAVRKAILDAFGDYRRDLEKLLVN
jgi:hypothetical protein